MNNYDFIIVGSGPAGSTMGRLLKSKYKVLILEKRTFQEGDSLQKNKCCGGLLAPDAQQMLAKFGLGIPNHILENPQLFAVKTIDLNTNIHKYYQRNYININREKFDRWLLSLVNKNIEIKLGAMYKNHESKKEFLQVEYIHEGKKYIVNTKYLVGADGAHSLVRNKIYPNNDLENYISIQEWYKTNKKHAYFGAIFDKEVTDFYSWVIPKGEYILLGSALKNDKDAIAKFELLKKKIRREKLFDLDEKVRRNGAFINRTMKPSQILLGKDRVFLIGEAAGLISPSSAEGISYAFRSAMYLVNAFNNSNHNILKLYKHKVLKLKMNILLKNIKSPAMYNPILRKYAMKSNLLSIDVVE